MISFFDRIDNIVGKGENAGYKIIVAQKMISFFDRVESIVGKGEPAFSHFPTMFSEEFFLGVAKSWDCVVKS